MANPTTRKYDPPPGIVALGTHVEVELSTVEGDVERLAFDIVPGTAADFATGFLGASTPLARHHGPARRHGRALYGRRHRPGDHPVRAPERAPADADASAARNAATREAVERAKTGDTIRLALTFSSKWGDYDPTPLEPSTQAERRGRR